MTTPDPNLFRPTAGFLGAPFSHDLGDAKAAILGMRFDCGADPSRIGSRAGPSAIREQAKRLGRPYPPFSSVDPVAHLGLVDCGDARVTPGRIDESYEVMEAAVGFIADQGAVPVTMGGDGAVTLPQLRAIGRRNPGLVALHFDAHTDAYPVEGQNRFTNATTFTCAAEENVIDAASSYHIGTRGPCRFPDIVEQARTLGYQVVTADEMYAKNIANVIAAVREAIGDRAGLSVLGHGLLRPVMRARRVRSDLGRRLGARGAGHPAEPRRYEHRRLRRQHGEPAARRRRHDRAARRDGHAALPAPGLPAAVARYYTSERLN